MDSQDQIVYRSLEATVYTKRDIGTALSLLVNCELMNMDELQRFAERAARMWPNREEQG